MNKRVKAIIDKEIDKNLITVKDCTLTSMIDRLLDDNPQVWTLRGPENFLNPEDVELLNKVKNNNEIKVIFDRVTLFEFDEVNIIESYKRQILNSYKEIKQQVAKKNKGYKNQIIFLEHDSEPVACFCGFGEGEYPILEEPKYIEYNYQDELYNGSGKLEYLIWDDIEKLIDIFEEKSLYDFLYDTPCFEAILNLYKYKTYQLLHRSFDELGKQLFEGIPVKLPLYIYGNEHDCEVMNIYVFE